MKFNAYSLQTLFSHNPSPNFMIFILLCSHKLTLPYSLDTYVLKKLWVSNKFITNWSRVKNFNKSLGCMSNPPWIILQPWTTFPFQNLCWFPLQWLQSTQGYSLLSCLTNSLRLWIVESKGNYENHVKGYNRSVYTSGKGSSFYGDLQVTG